TPPEKPDGEVPDMADGTPPEKPNGEAPDMAGAPGGMAQAPDNYTAVQSYTEDTSSSGESISSTGTDENAVLVSEGADVSLKDMEIDRTSSDSTGGDNSSFYGVGAALLATDGTLSVKDSTITTDAAGGAGLFAYGDGTVYAADCTITTQQDTSGGVHAAGGGTLYAWNVTAETNGTSSAAVRSDRGGGTMVINGGSYTSNGQDSPAVYCTADIAIKDADLTATGSEAVCIEGLNTLRLYDCDLSGNMPDDQRNDNTWTVIVYQSMSGDSEVGNGTFQMEGGTLTSGNGGLFYTTNTECTITLKDGEITAADDSEFLLQCTGNNNSRGWGQSGSNGSDCHFTAISQELKGDVIWDSISQLDFYLAEDSYFSGAVYADDTYAADGDGYCNVTVDADSTWVVTGDCRISTLSSSGTVIDESGRTVTVQNSDGTVLVEGDSDYIITADSYNDTADMSGSTSVDTWDNHEIEKPESLA
ncbi:MAG: hypothetical protein Q4C61_17900, partial [Lachnospiraceae bacterium]|nr:hypothetical protein [Lachnospiraceae bacterium]